jgi:predicted GNAT family N-acyltransferase
LLSCECPPELRALAFGSSAYRASLLLRERVLRAPLGMRLTEADTAAEENQLHFGLYSGGGLIACVVIKPLADSSRKKLRQMAVAENYRGRGIGRALLNAVEAAMKELGVDVIELSARVAAEGFYQKLGYQGSGDPYLEQGIPHILMHKQL